ncbi:MAG: prephenate dehydrogenase [Myxococcota bacterium]|nr:prephenate dehydrogenase [Myxococcota bacterium]
MSRDFGKVAVLGLGLLGGSVGLALRKRELADCVAAASRSQAPLKQALAEGAVDEIGDIPHCVEGAELVVLASPVGAMASVLSEAAPHLAPGTRVTDVGSIKGFLAETLPGLLPGGVDYVGAHPMAGGHQRGARHARADLFDGAPCVISAGASVSEEAVSRVVHFWESLGANIVFRDAEDHDQEVAWISHVPHALAFAYAHALQKAPASASELAGPGFRDFTRIAQSDPCMWSEILNTNRKAVAGVLQSVGASLSELGRAIESGDLSAQESFLAQGSDALAASTSGSMESGQAVSRTNVRSGDVNPEIQAD